MKEIIKHGGSYYMENASVSDVEGIEVMIKRGNHKSEIKNFLIQSKLESGSVSL